MIVQTRTVHTDPVNHPKAQGFYVRPDDDRTYPGIVLIQEWWGIEPHIRELAQRLASEGFVVLVPDLYHGKVATEPDSAGKLMMATVEHMSRAVAEIVAALEFLRSESGVAPKKLGLMGFCMGGLLTFKVAAQYPHLAAISPWYPVMYDPTPEEVAQVSAAVLAIYGERDSFVPLEQVEKVKGLYAAAGKDAEFRVYAGAGHAFNNPDHGMYVAEAAKDAWARAVAFFKAKLV